MTGLYRLACHDHGYLHYKKVEEFYTYKCSYDKVIKIMHKNIVFLNNVSRTIKLPLLVTFIKQKQWSFSPEFSIE